jgi:hypothetical protein
LALVPQTTDVGPTIRHRPNIPGAPLVPFKRARTEKSAPTRSLVQATIFATRGELRLGQREECHEGVVISLIEEPKMLPSLDTWARVLSTKGNSYDGNLSALNLDGCFFAYELTLHVTSKNFPRKYKIVRVESVKRLPLDYSLLELIYCAWVRCHSRNRQINSEQCFLALLDSLEWFRQYDYLAALLSEDKPDVPLNEFIANAVLPKPHDELKRRTDFKGLPVNQRILRLHPHLSQMVDESDYFYDGPTCHQVFLKSWNSGYRFLYSDSLLKEVGHTLEQNPLALFFRSTNTFPVETLEPKVLPYVARLKDSALEPGDQLLVTEYSKYRNALKRNDVLTSSCIPLSMCPISRPTLAVLVERQILTETQVVLPGKITHVDVVQDVADARAEERLAHSLTKRRQMSVREMPSVDASFIDRLDADQRRAFNSCFTHGLSIFNARPGYGKSFVIARAILAAAFDLGRRVLVCAPTGQAIEVIIKSFEDCLKTLPERYRQSWRDNLQWVNEDSDILDIQTVFLVGRDIGRIVICTIQSVNYDLEVVNPGRDRLEPSLFDMVFVDETSIASLSDLDAFFYHLNTQANVILSGDIDQLPSIEGPSVLPTLVSMLTNSPETCPRGWNLCSLSILYRVEDTTQIISDNLNRIRKLNTAWREFELPPQSDPLVLSPWVQIHCQSNGYDYVLDALGSLLKKTNRTALFDNTLVITYYNDDRISLNNLIRDKFYKHKQPKEKSGYGFFQKHEVVVFNRKVRAERGRIFNRTRSRIEKIEVAFKVNGNARFTIPEFKEAIKERLPIEWMKIEAVTIDIWNKCRLSLAGGQVVLLTNVRPSDIALAWVLTVYGAQGGQADTVFYYLTQNPDLLYRQLSIASVYTALSRAKKKVVIVGDIERLKQNIAFSPIPTNYSTLPYHIGSIEKKAF